MSASLDWMSANMSVVRAVIERNAAASAATSAGRTSDFWAEIFAARQSDIDLNNIMVCRRDGHAYGIGDDRHGTIEQERNFSARMHHIFKRMVSPEFVAKLPETIFGAPLAFEHDGVVRSASFWINAATTQRVVEFLQRFGKRGRLRVLEIGAGWGACALQLHHAIEIESYTIIDLPQNLVISTLHLAYALADRRLEFFDVAGDRIAEVAPGTITACLPGTIGRIGAKFDLVLNSFSLQEMALDSAGAYIDFVGAVLSDDGIFVSLNSHAKAGVRQPTDYGYGRFHIHHWGTFRASPSAYHNTIPYEVVVGRRRTNSPEYPDAAQNALGWLMQLGLDRDLRALCDAFVGGTLDARQRAMLGQYEQFFSARTDDERLALLENLRSVDNSPVWPFVSAHLSLVRRDAATCARCLQEACARGLSGFARVRAEVLLATLEHGGGFLARLFRGSRKPALIGPIDGLDVAFAYPEAAAMVSRGDPRPLILQTNHILRRRGRAKWYR